MAEKMRLNNLKDYAVGIKTPEKEYDINILPHSFTMVTQDEVDYLMATCTLLQDGVLQLQGEKQKELADVMGIDMENNANFMSDEDIRKKLSGNANQLKKWLDSEKINPDVMAQIAKIAKGMNLSMNKIQVLQEKLPNYDFMSK